MNHTALEFRTAPIKKFRPHPFLKGIPILPTESEDFQRMTASIAVDGVIDPLKCIGGPTKDVLLVVDGLHRLTIANEQGLKELPYRLVEGYEVVDLVCLSAVRAEWTKSALAYRLWPLFSGNACGHGGNRKSKGNDFPLMSSLDIAEKLRVSDKLVDQAKRIHLLFASQPKLRAELEPRILKGEIGLHQVNGKTKGKSTPPSRKDRPSVKALESLFHRSSKSFTHWEKWEPDDQRRATNVVAESIRKLPKDAQIGILETLEIAWRP